MPRIAVHGSATRSLAPERGTIYLSVNVAGDARADVLAAAQRAHAAVAAAARRHVDAGDATGWQSPDVRVWAFSDWVLVPAGRGVAPGQQEQVTRYRAGADVQVTFTRLDALGELVAQAGALDGVDVLRVEWTLTDTTRDDLLRMVRAEASRDALGRAEDYAAALDLSPVRLVALYEEGLHPGLGLQPDGPSPRHLARASALETGGFDLRPHDIEVTARVTAELESGH
ncbi:SIMPL domain-containing protein [Xylanimonas allomyrinae]|uniref:SIMPL domain-containing protein n=1 Tax=Xylanimonas allomyrinae TaxID=2509459 RepID=A0A4P6ELT3_9MICO|nr:SIMPL domain-containing protein [Xylanimonas allomyrinae]QAY62229.1 SIMPL domain-containing protein [Xylanimonas allomyrinae]